MLWLGIDFETTGLSVKEDRITEIGAVLWDVRRKAPVQMFNALIKVDRPLTPEIQKLTGIADSDLKEHGEEFIDAAKGLAKLFEKASHVVAHNGTNFDKPFFHEECVRNNVATWDRPWIDTATDVPYPNTIQTRKLVHLAAEHNFLNPFAHRAVFDVLTMLSVVSQYDHEEILRYNSSPSITIKADVDYNNRAKASSRGYRWDQANKQWIKTIKNFQLEQEKKECDFLVIPLSEEKK